MFKPMYRIALCCVICIGSVCGALSAEAGKDVLMVIPARMRVLKLAFDMNWLRSVSVVSYQGDVKSDEPLLHLWSGSEWSYVSMADFVAGRFLRSVPDSVVLVGDDEMLPAVLAENISWYCSVVRVETIDIADMINRLDLVFEFRENDWKWLAKRYGLILTDIYKDRRTINPYAMRRSQLPVEIPVQEMNAEGVPPAVLMEERKIEGVVLIEEISVESPEEGGAPGMQ